MDSIDNDLVVRSLNFHGHQLTNFMKDQPIFSSLDLKGVDYHLYHSRNKELRMDDRGRRLIVHKFISQNTRTLFRTRAESSSTSGICCDDIVPPIETFAARHVSKDDRVRRLYELLREGDILYCTVIGKNVSGLLLSVLCFAPESGKARMASDLGLKAFCPASEMIPADEGKSFDQESVFVWRRKLLILFQPSLIYLYLNEPTPNNFSLVGSQFFPYRIVAEEIENIWKELGLNPATAKPLNYVSFGILLR